jgi:hypothetical protein
MCILIFWQQIFKKKILTGCKTTKQQNSHICLFVIFRSPQSDGQKLEPSFRNLYHCTKTVQDQNIL